MNDPQADCEELLSFVIPFAKKILGEKGGFLPFGIMMLTNGDFATATGADGSIIPDPADRIGWLKNAFRRRARAGEIVACVLVHEIIITSPDGGQSDAIAAALDHVDAGSVRLVFPYRLGDEGVSIAGPFRQSGDNDVFGVYAD